MCVKREDPATLPSMVGWIANGIPPCPPRRKVRQGDFIGGGRDGAPSTWRLGGQGLHPCRGKPAPFTERSLESRVLRGREGAEEV